MLIVVADDLPKSALDLLRAEGWSVDARSGRTPEQLIADLAGADALVVRSATKVTADIINRAPIEADANLVAGKHVVKRYPDAVPALLAGPDHYLVDSQSAGSDPPSLVARSVDYLWRFRAVCDDPASLPEAAQLIAVVHIHIVDVAAGAVEQDGHALRTVDALHPAGELAAVVGRDVTAVVGGAA